MVALGESRIFSLVDIYMNTSMLDRSSELHPSFSRTTRQAKKHGRGNDKP